jgi:ribosome-associated protein
MLTPFEVAKHALSALSDKKANDIKMLRTTDVTTLADYFIIATATASTHLKTLSDEIEKQLKECGENQLRREGHRTGDWILLDYGCVIVHLFMQEAREFYTLERIWSDAEDVNISELVDTACLTGHYN